jgi:CTP synthase (UTP-ammonia lyase)
MAQHMCVGLEGPGLRPSQHWINYTASDKDAAAGDKPRGFSIQRLGAIGVQPDIVRPREWLNKNYEKRIATETYVPRRDSRRIVNGS